MSRVDIRVLAGEPTDGTGRVLIHYFVRDPAGPARTPLRVEPTPLGPLRLGGAVGRIACRPGLAAVTPQTVAGVSRPVCHSDDVRAVTCPACRAGDDYHKGQALLEGATRPAPAG